MKKDISKINKKLAIVGALGALIILLGITRLGIVPWFSGVSITIMHLPVIVGTIIAGPVAGICIAIIFGIFSLLQAAVAPAGGIDPYFVNPLISILPRLSIPLFTWLSYLIASKIRVLPKFVSIAKAAFLGSLANTFFTLLALVIAKAITWQIMITVVVANGIPEAIGALLLCTPVCAAWLRISMRAKSRLSQEENN